MQALAAAGERIGGPMYRKSTLEDCRAIYQLICELEQKELPYQGLIVIRYYLALRGAENGVTIMVTPFFCVQG